MGRAGGQPANARNAQRKREVCGKNGWGAGDGCSGRFMACSRSGSTRSMQSAVDHAPRRALPHCYTSVYGRNTWDDRRVKNGTRRVRRRWDRREYGVILGQGFAGLRPEATAWFVGADPQELMNRIEVSHAGEKDCGTGWVDFRVGVSCVGVLFGIGVGIGSDLCVHAGLDGALQLQRWGGRDAGVPSRLWGIRRMCVWTGRGDGRFRGQCGHGRHGRARWRCRSWSWGRGDGGHSWESWGCRRGWRCRVPGIWGARDGPNRRELLHRPHGSDTRTVCELGGHRAIDDRSASALLLEQEFRAEPSLHGRDLRVYDGLRDASSALRRLVRCSRLLCCDGKAFVWCDWGRTGSGGQTFGRFCKPMASRVLVGRHPLLPLW